MLLADAVAADNARVIEVLEHGGFEGEALDESGPASHVLAEDLECDMPAVTLLEGEVNGAGAARADLAQDAKVAEGDRLWWRSPYPKAGQRPRPLQAGPVGLIQDFIPVVGAGGCGGFAAMGRLGRESPPVTCC